MTVVVNEFEVVPAIEPPEPPGAQDTPRELPFFDVERDVLRCIERERARAARLHAS